MSADLSEIKPLSSLQVRNHNLPGGKMVRFAEVTLPASKSESNRALMIAAYGGFASDFPHLSDSNDTLILKEMLQRTPSESIQKKSVEVDIADCGTAARFLTTYLANKEGKWLLTGTERMKQRPIKSLVEALRELGADIQYVEKEGFLPLHIVGKSLSGGKVSVDMSQSSQFASSLLLAAPIWDKGLELELKGDLNSLPYLEMTLAMMRHFGTEAERKGRTIVVKHKPYHYTDFTISADWTAASYWYEMAAFSEACEIRLNRLSWPETLRDQPGLQGDSIIAEWMQQLGVFTTSYENGILLTKRPVELRPLSIEFSHHPDLYPTMAATCAGLGVEASFKGLENLHLKESDRVEAMQEELAKIGQSPLRFCSHGDHRVVMSLAPLSLLFGIVSFDHPEVVNKSYPNYWCDADFLRY